MEHFEQLRSLIEKLGAMIQRELAQNPLPARSQFEQDLATVVRATVAANQATGFEPIYQFDCAVVLDLQALGQFADARACLGRQAL